MAKRGTLLVAVLSEGNKEINIQDSKSPQKIFPLIKEEMSVLEILNHPNIVSHYGVEVHRDKVNIFMEYCEGGL
ncbi:AIF_collapsed_G0031940.mRNA.1.CDS.1 [Saccharomyces cerevisiae]|nr:AIF_collapsed_G0031940.mRNA.1.CDS.1 [Saccharomyces cerevisiae]